MLLEVVVPAHLLVNEYEAKRMYYGPCLLVSDDDLFRFEKLRNTSFEVLRCFLFFHIIRLRMRKTKNGCESNT